MENFACETQVFNGSNKCFIVKDHAFPYQEFRKTLRFFEVFYLLVLAEFVTLFAASMPVRSLVGFVFSLCVSVSYPLIYILPAVVVTLLAACLLNCAKHIDVRYKRFALFLSVSLSSAIVLLALFVDYKIFSLFHFHVNGFVLNLLLTPGGIDSLAASNGTYVAVMFLMLFAAAIAAGCLWGAQYTSKRFDVSLKTELIMLCVCLLVLITSGMAERFLFGYEDYTGKTAVFDLARKVPWYVPTHVKTFLRSLGVPETRHENLVLKNRERALQYPLKPLQVVRPERALNIVWLVAESWRADTLNRKIMPEASEFSKQCLRFHNHYSTGNGTRMGMFGMFYGLYGSYWFSALSDKRAPVILQTLQKEHYQFDMYTSAKFTYPEFDKTVFANVPKEKLHQSNHRGGFVYDRSNVSGLLNFIEHRDRTRPFMTFMFFESPHAPYTFPDDCIVVKDYLETFNYATVDIAHNIEKIKNRYRNAVHHLDTQLGRIFSYLDDAGLLSNTIVVVTGDHGEEFMEKGHWGHNESFHQEQIRPPLLLHIPGCKPGDIYFMSSHLDLPATIAPFIGIQNPPSDYTLGHDLLSDLHGTYQVCASWNDLCYIDNEYKYSFATNQYLLGDSKLTSLDDVPISGFDDFVGKRRERLADFMKNAGVFYKN